MPFRIGGLEVMAGMFLASNTGYPLCTRTVLCGCENCASKFGHDKNVTRHRYSSKSSKNSMLLMCPMYEIYSVPFNYTRLSPV